MKIFEVSQHAVFKIIKNCILDKFEKKKAACMMQRLFSFNEAKTLSKSFFNIDAKNQTIKVQYRQNEARNI